MKKNNSTQFNVIIYDVNKKEFVPYDVIPYFVDCYKEIKNKKNAPKTFEEFIKFVEGNSMYMYWGRCEWEIICSSFPCEDVKKKIDVNWQIKMNLELITQILIKNLGLTL